MFIDSQPIYLSTNNKSHLITRGVQKYQPIDKIDWFNPI